MGAGSSIHKDTLSSILLSRELEEGSLKLASDRLFRVSFTNYIKSGIWLDRLAQLVPDTHFALSRANSGEDNELIIRLKEYGIDKKRLATFESFTSDEYSPKPSASFHGYGDLYSSGETTGFNQEELLGILFAVLYPLYLISREYKSFLKYGIQHGIGTKDDCSIVSFSSVNQAGTNTAQSNPSQRAQDLMLNCAIYYDESHLQKQLANPDWIRQVCPIFRDHPLPLCIIDTARGGLPILFANKSFCLLFGYEEPELIGKDFSMLGGADTEIKQLKRMNSSIRSADIIKFFITLQNKSKKAMFDLMAQKSVGSYSLSAHFVQSKSASLEMLNMVDDVLILLSYLAKPPPPPARPKWVPAPIAIFARAASTVLHVASPGSRSSSSPTSESGRNNQGPGTPTSFRNRSLSNGGSVRSGNRNVRDARMRRGSRSEMNPRSYRSTGGGSVGLEVVGEGISEEPTHVEQFVQINTAEVEDGVVEQLPAIQVEQEA